MKSQSSHSVVVLMPRENLWTNQSPSIRSPSNRSPSNRSNRNRTWLNGIVRLIIWLFLSSLIITWLSSLFLSNSTYVYKIKQQFQTNKAVDPPKNQYQYSKQAVPPSPRIDNAPLVEHWRMCPLAHRFPYLSSNKTLDQFGYPDMDDPEWSTKHQWADSSYPRVFIPDLSNNRLFSLIVSETVYDVKPGHWTAIATIHQVDMINGDYIPGKLEHGGHPMPHIEYLQTIGHLLTCSDSIGNIRQPAELVFSYFFFHIHCPFSLRPDTPQSVANHQRYSSSDFQTSNGTIQSKWAQTNENFDSKTMINLFRDFSIETVRFYHPLFLEAESRGNLTGAWQLNSVIQSIELIKKAYESQSNNMRDWLLMQSNGLLPNAVPLSIPMCMARVPRVDVTYCTAPLLNSAYINDFHAHLQYHVALGVQKFIVYDRYALFDDVIRPYIDSGLVDYQPFPLPWRNQVTPQVIKQQRWAYYADQTLALESCRIRAVGISSWVLYKDLDEWLTFPSNASFVRQDRTARCYSGEWKKSPSSLFRATGAKDYVHINVGLSEAEKIKNRGDEITVWSINQTSSLSDSRTSLYSYITPKFAQSFIDTHQKSNEGVWSNITCPSPLLAWLTSLTDIRLMQRLTYVPDRNQPFAHHDPINNMLPLTQSISTSSTDNPEQRRPILLSDHLRVKSRWQFYRLCDVPVQGNAFNHVNDTQENRGSAAPPNHKLLFDRFPYDAGYIPVQSIRFPKWIARPELPGLFVHNLFNAVEVSKDPTNFDWKPFLHQEINENRPCEEIHFKHYKNYPNPREVDPNAVIPIEHFHSTWSNIVKNANLHEKQI